MIVAPKLGSSFSVKPNLVWAVALGFPAEKRRAFSLGLVDLMTQLRIAIRAGARR